MAFNSSFDYQDQSFSLQTTYGDNMTITLDFLEGRMRSGTQQTIVAAVQVGASLAVLVVLLLLTTAEKRRLPVFYLNTLALLLVAISQLTASIYFLTGWYSPYILLTGDFTFLSSSAQANSILGGATSLLLLTTIHASLLIQVRAVLTTLSRHRRLIFSSVLFLCLSSFLLRSAQFVLAIATNILQPDSPPSPAMRPLTQTRDAALALSISASSAVFVAKLAHTVRERTALGLQPMRAMNVVMIGGMQTMLIPALFAVLQFAAPETHLDSLVLSSVALSLPLTALWAAGASQARAESLLAAGRRGAVVGVYAEGKASGGSSGSGEEWKSQGLEEDMEMQDVGKGWK